MNRPDSPSVFLILEKVGLIISGRLGASAPSRQETMSSFFDFTSVFIFCFGPQAALFRVISGTNAVPEKRETRNRESPVSLRETFGRDKITCKVKQGRMAGSPGLLMDQENIDRPDSGCVEEQNWPHIADPPRQWSWRILGPNNCQHIPREWVPERSSLKISPTHQPTQIKRTICFLSLHLVDHLVLN